MTKEELEDQIREFWGDKARYSAETKDALEELATLCQELADVLEET